MVGEAEDGKPENGHEDPFATVSPARAERSERQIAAPKIPGHA